jgi:hypothetical protein
MVFCGIVFAVAAFKEVGSRVAASPLAVPPKRPSLASSLVVGLLVTHAVGRIGSSAAGLPAGR